MSSNPPWKEAASLIVFTKASMSQKVGQSLSKSMVVASRMQDEKHKAVASQSSAIAKTDYRIMMVKRSGLSSFMASAFVFPGGALEIADFSPRWWTVFDTCGVSRNELNQYVKGKKGPRPEIVTDSLTLKKAAVDQVDQAGGLLPADVGLRISALRETFEETGVLILTDPRIQGQGAHAFSDSQLAGDLSNWRERVRNNASSFIDLCLAIGLCPDIWSLYEWSNWLTPISVGHKRYDTIFYFCCLENQPKVVLDNAEVTSLKWCTPLEMLDEHVAGRVFLPPPQAYELARIHHLSNFSSVNKFARQREALGLHRWLPVIVTCKDGAISFLPGDSQYPEKADLIGREPVPDYPQTIVEMRAQSISLNRIELRGPICRTHCNFRLPCGHPAPITFPALATTSSTTTQSLL